MLLKVHFPSSAMSKLKVLDQIILQIDFSNQ